MRRIHFLRHAFERSTKRVHKTGRLRMLPCLLAQAVVIAICGSAASAQSADSDEPSAPGYENLFVSPDGEERKVVVDAGKADEFRGWIIPELLPFVRSGRIVLPAVPKLRFHWRLSDDWEVKTGERRGKLTSNGGFDYSAGLGAAFPFGRRDEVEQDNDPARMAKKILWNAASNFWGQSVILSSFELASLVDDRLAGRFEGVYARMYPNRIEGAPGVGQEFRELIRFLQPSVADGFAWLTFRFAGPTEDFLWIYSPAVRKVREVTASNRTDPLLDMAVSLEDWFTFSGKIDAFDTRVLESRTALIPFASERLGKIEALTDNCIQPVRNDQEEGTSWNFESPRFFNGAAWLPTSVVWVPREVWRVELVPTDPYSAYGRQILYVDKDSFLPFVKIVYDKVGTLDTLVVSAFGLSTSEDKTGKAFFPLLTAVEQVSEKKAATIRYTQLRYCATPPVDLPFQNLDPARLLPTEPNLPAAPSEPAPPPEHD